jgi:prophage regulatory protein
VSRNRRQLELPAHWEKRDMPVLRKIQVLRLPAVIEKTGLGRDTVYRGGREGWFPKPIKISVRATGWYQHEIELYLERCERVVLGDLNASQAAHQKKVSASGQLPSARRVKRRSARQKSATAA